MDPVAAAQVAMDGGVVVTAKWDSFHGIRT
jgi:hypothetical protein